MDLKTIVAITGLNGLYRSITQRGDGVIVTSLETKETKFVPARSHQFIALDGISIFTNDGGSKDLKEVFAEMLRKEPAHPLPDLNASTDELKKYFKTILPDYDEARVYVSDIKKTLKWYTALKKANLLTEEEKESTGAEKGKAEK